MRSQISTPNFSRFIIPQKLITRISLLLLTLGFFGGVWGQVSISPGGTYSQNFNSIGTTATATLPDGWVCEKNTLARSVTVAYSTLTTTTTQNVLAYNVAMSSSAPNGLWNFGGGASSGDQSVGGISSGSASKSVNYFLKLDNSSSTASIPSFSISYNVERYRNGSNAVGFSVRMYYSTSGLANSWTEITSAIASFAANNDNNGASSNPLQVMSISNVSLAQSLSANGSIYFAWSYSVTSGTTTSSAQALGIDDVVITAGCPTGTFTGATGGDWSLSSNWCGGAAPTSSTNVVIPANTTVYLDEASTTVANLTIDGTLDVQAGKQLTVDGTLTNNGILILENGATLVQTGSNANAGSGGTYEVKQVITGSSSGSAPNGRGWYIGSPVSGATSNLFAPSNSTNLIYHWNANQTTPNWAQYAAGSGTTLDVGKGYAVRIGESSSTITFSSSTLNNAPASTPIAIPCYKQASTNYQGFNLVSNPFASYLDWNDVWAGTNATNFESTIHYRVANASNVMVFDTYNAQNGQGTSNSTGVSSATRYIPPMQAFWVRTAAAVSTSTNAVNLSLDNSMRDHYTSVVNGWSAGLKSTAQDFPMFLRLNIEQGTFKDQMLVFLKQQASSHYDAYDSEKMFLSGYPQLYTQVSNRKLVFNGLNSNKKITVIPVVVDIPTAGLFTFRAEEFNAEAGLILLEDKQEGITQDLTINDVYTFYANAGTITNRFFIRFHQLDPSITAQGPSNSWVDDDNEINEGGSIVVATNGRGKVTIQQDIDPLASDDSDVTIRDAAGREVLSGKLSGIESVFQLDAPSGLYFVAVQLNGQVEVKKIFVQQ